jgi:hypothetical protein
MIRYSLRYGHHWSSIMDDANEVHRFDTLTEALDFKSELELSSVAHTYNVFPYDASAK